MAEGREREGGEGLYRRGRGRVDVYCTRGKKKYDMGREATKKALSKATKREKKGEGERDKKKGRGGGFPPMVLAGKEKSTVA